MRVSFPALQTACSGQRCQVDIDHAADLHVVERQIAHQMNGTRALLEISLGEIRGLVIETHPELRPTLRLGKLDVNVVSIDAGLQSLNRSLRPQAGLYRVLPFRETLDQVIALIVLPRLSGRLFGPRPRS